MQQAESSRDTVQRRKNSCLRDAFVFLLWHTSRHQPITVIGRRCRSRADILQPGTVEADLVTVRFQRQTAVVIIDLFATVATYPGGNAQRLQFYIA